MPRGVVETVGERHVGFRDEALGGTRFVNRTWADGFVPTEGDEVELVLRRPRPEENPTIMSAVEELERKLESLRGECGPVDHEAQEALRRAIMSASCVDLDEFRELVGQWTTMVLSAGALLEADVAFMFQAGVEYGRMLRAREVQPAELTEARAAVESLSAKYDELASTTRTLIRSIRNYVARVNPVLAEHIDAALAQIDAQFEEKAA